VTSQSHAPPTDCRHLACASTLRRHWSKAVCASPHCQDSNTLALLSFTSPLSHPRFHCSLARLLVFVLFVDMSQCLEVGLVGRCGHHAVGVVEEDRRSAGERAKIRRNASMLITMATVQFRIGPATHRLAQVHDINASVNNVM